MSVRRVIAVGLAIAVGLGGGIHARAQAVEQQRQEVVAEALAVSARVDEAKARSAVIADGISRAEAEAAAFEALLEVRPAFVDELKKFAAALKRAEGKVDAEPTKKSAVSEQNKVLAERQDTDVITAATAKVRELTASLETRITEWERAQARARQSTGVPSTRYDRSGPDGYARVRAALNRVGGAGVGLYESSSCAGGSAPACANSNGYIKYRADVANWSSGRLHWAMAHELAHIYQFRVWGRLNSSSSYASLFRGDPEFLANCMALVRGYAGSVGCNSEQRAWASGIWVGAVR